MVDQSKLFVTLEKDFDETEKKKKNHRGAYPNTNENREAFDAFCHKKCSQQHQPSLCRFWRTNYIEINSNKMRGSRTALITSILGVCQGFSVVPSSQAGQMSLTTSSFSCSTERGQTRLHSSLDEETKQEQELQDNYENDLEKLRQMIQDGALQNSSFHLLVEDMQLPLKESQKESVMVNDSKGALTKLVEANVFDPTMKIVSSEIGVKNFVSKSIKPNQLPDSSQVPIDLLLSRTMDTVEDVAVHLARIPYEKGNARLKSEMEEMRKTVVILGSGWAAHALMKVADTTKLRLVVVSPTNHFVFTPMLASSSVGTVEYRSMTEAVRSANPMIENYVEGKATGVDIQNKKVTVQLNSLLDNVREGDPPTIDLDYDHLVVSVGCKVNTQKVPGAENALRLKTTEDAVKLRRAIGECLEYASRPDVAGADKAGERRKRATFVIVGGGPTGVELAGEILDLAADITRPHKGAYPRLKGDIEVVLAHSGSELVPQFEPRLREEALKSLERKGAKIYLNTRVNEVGDGYADFATKKFDPETGEVVGRDEFRLSTGLTVWAAGTAPVSFVSELLDQLPDEARNRDGRVKVDKWLRPAMPSADLMGSILVMGDAAAFPESSDTITSDKLLPQTAQVAGQQGAYTARMLARGYDLTVTPPILQCTDGSDKCDVYFDAAMMQWLQVRGLSTAPGFAFLNLGLLAYLGGGESLAQVQVGDYPLFSYFGSIAFVLWRSVYLVKQVATRNRVLVTFDWIKSAIFGRDMTRF